MVEHLAQGSSHTRPPGLLAVNGVHRLVGEQSHAPTAAPTSVGLLSASAPSNDVRVVDPARERCRASSLGEELRIVVEDGEEVEEDHAQAEEGDLSASSVVGCVRSGVPSLAREEGSVRVTGACSSAATGQPKTRTMI